MPDRPQIDADTDSLLFQAGFSGRPKMGTAGGDDFAVKVSADGTTWFDAMESVPSRDKLERAMTLFTDAARAETRQRDINRLRAAIRGRADHEEIERLWDKLERWL